MLAVSVAIIGLLLVLHPVTVTTYVYRALLLPFFLGILVPPFTWLSYLSQRWHAPLVLATVALLGIFSSTATNDIRTIPHPTVMKKLPSAAEEPLHSDNRAAEEWTVARAQWRGVWPGFLNRPAIYSTVERWAHVNECEFGFADPSRLQSKDEKERMLAEGERKKSDNCPRPIL